MPEIQIMMRDLNLVSNVCNISLHQHIQYLVKIFKVSKRANASQNVLEDVS